MADGKTARFRGRKPLLHLIGLCLVPANLKSDDGNECVAVVDMAHAKEWNEERIGKLSIWISIYLAYYFFLIGAPGSHDWWWQYLSAGVSLVMATLTLRLFFRVIAVHDFIIALIDWASSPHSFAPTEKK
jgi:hypothetical protein